MCFFTLSVTTAGHFRRVFISIDLRSPPGAEPTNSLNTHADLSASSRSSKLYMITVQQAEKKERKKTYMSKSEIKIGFILTI
jgi:hypothetical protein